MLLFCLHAATFEWSRLAPYRGKPMKNSKEYLKMTTKIRAEACSKVHFSIFFRCVRRFWWLNGPKVSFSPVNAHSFETWIRAPEPTSKALNFHRTRAASQNGTIFLGGSRIPRASKVCPKKGTVQMEKQWFSNLCIFWDLFLFPRIWHTGNVLTYFGTDRASKQMFHGSRFLDLWMDMFADFAECRKFPEQC
jgi:hypothetical protein